MITEPFMGSVIFLFTITFLPLRQNYDTCIQKNIVI